MTEEEKLVRLTQNLMKYLTSEIAKQKKLELSTKVYMLDSMRAAIKQVSDLKIR